MSGEEQHVSVMAKWNPSGAVVQKLLYIVSGSLPLCTHPGEAMPSLEGGAGGDLHTRICLIYVSVD